MKIFLFIISLFIIILVACDVKSDKPSVPDILHLEEETSHSGFRYPQLYRFHDDERKVICYVSTSANGGGVSCIRDVLEK